MRAVVAALVVLIAVSCAGIQTGQTSPTGEATRLALEAVLQKRADALVKGDLAAFQAVTDQERPAFRRQQRERFDMVKRGVPRVEGTKVARTEPYLDKYVRAYVEETPEAGLLATAATPSYRRAYFRNAEGRWLLTEPKADELGGEKTRTIGDLKVEYWGIDESIVEALAREANAAREFAARIVPGTSPPPFALRIYPTAETIGLEGYDVIASHIVHGRDPYVRVYRTWWTASLADVAEFTRFALKDQAVGWARDLRAPSTYFRLDWWLRHGFGDLVAGPERNATALRATCEGAPTFKELFDGPPAVNEMEGGGMAGRDTAPTYAFYGPPQASRYILHARTMVEYIRATFGDSAYWRLLDAYRESPDPKVAYSSALKVSPDHFYGGWLAWTKTKYCA